MSFPQTVPLRPDVSIADYHLDPGVQPRGMGENLSRKPRPHAPLRHVDGASPCLAFICELGTAYGVIDFFDDRHGGADADIARWREGHPASPAVENRGAYFLFEAADLTGERWLCQIQSLRCSYESLFFGYRNECLELSQVH